MREGALTVGQSHRAAFLPSLLGHTSSFALSLPLMSSHLPSCGGRCWDQARRCSLAASSGLGDSDVWAEPAARPVVCLSSGNCLSFGYFFLGASAGAMVSDLLTFLRAVLTQTSVRSLLQDVVHGMVLGRKVTCFISFLSKFSFHRHMET